MPMALLAAVAMTCLQGAAFAGVPMQPTHRTVQVSAKGLNLANPADLARLNQRIGAAAADACKPEDFRDLRAVADRPACVKAAIASANAKRDVLVARAQAEQLAARINPEPATN
jgi:UrcA family protein